LQPGIVDVLEYKNSSCAKALFAPCTLTTSVLPLALIATVPPNKSFSPISPVGSNCISVTAIFETCGEAIDVQENAARIADVR
jgi:hypothetical protein